MSKYKGVLFDLDDTVVYSEESRFRATNKVLEHYNVVISKREWKQQFRSLSSLKMFDILKDRNHLDYDSKEMYKQAHDIRLNLEEDEGVKLVEGILELFHFLEKKEIPFVICTGGTTGHGKKVLKQHNLDYIELIGREYYTKRKPAPDAFLEGLKRLGLRGDEVLVFEDSYTGIQSGLAAGCQVIGVNTNEEEDVDSLDILAKIKTFEELDYSIFD
ncbi:MAG: HAD family phosphatase [Nanoarchaeota archaeon]|nr:HAD family phosphatase [Nanoarchaeota archaeon]